MKYTQVVVSDVVVFRHKNFVSILSLLTIFISVMDNILLMFFILLIYVCTKSI